MTGGLRWSFNGSRAHLPSSLTHTQRQPSYSVISMTCVLAFDKGLFLDCFYRHCYSLALQDSHGEERPEQWLHVYVNEVKMF